MTDYAYNGKPCCYCQSKFLPVFQREAQELGIVDGPLPLSQIIGGAESSGNTHLNGGADDTYPLGSIRDVRAYVRLSRDMGADATWLRPEDWDHDGGVAHVHRVLTNCPHNWLARYQIDAVRAGFNGLGRGGRGAPDDGPRPLSNRTWQEGVKWAKRRQRRRALNRKIDAVRAEKAKIVAAAAKLDAKLKSLRTRRDALK